MNESVAVKPTSTILLVAAPINESVAARAFRIPRVNAAVIVKVAVSAFRNDLDTEILPTKLSVPVRAFMNDLEAEILPTKLSVAENALPAAFVSVPIKLSVAAMVFLIILV